MALTDNHYIARRHAAAFFRQGRHSDLLRIAAGPDRAAFGALANSTGRRCSMFWPERYQFSVQPCGILGDIVTCHPLIFYRPLMVSKA